ncbi:hypothetical protein Mapa_013834 [Marchantia paleacea]|nr:hypothetical protein Mapa_013834 [Marchantia paleacea]
MSKSVDIRFQLEVVAWGFGPDIYIFKMIQNKRVQSNRSPVCQSALIQLNKTD